ncbi:MAG: glycoside hydrolase family 44 protein [Anaerolineales bacterium]
MRRIPLIFILIMFWISACGQPQSATPFGPTFTPTVTAFPTSTAVPTPFPNSLYVNPSISLGAISPLIYGSNYGPWIALSVSGLDPAVNSGITNLRFPAGAWGDNNDIKSYYIDNFMFLLQKMNATAMINVRLKNGTPEQAAALVNYVNIQKGYGVKYWGIGNEPTLYNSELPDGYDVDLLNQQWRAIALAMKQADPSIQLVGPEIHQFSFDVTGTTNYDINTAKDRNGKYWMDEFLKANGDLVDIVSIHRYPFPKSQTAGSPSIEELQVNAREWDKIIAHLRDVIHENTGKDLPIAVTEFNSAYDKSVGSESSPDSHFNAIWLGDVLGRLIKNKVFMAHQWMFTSKGGDGGWGLIGQSDVYPSYYTYQMYKMLGSELVYSSSDQENLSIYAAKRSDGKLTIMVINLSLQEQTKLLRIAGQDSAKGEAWLFDPSHKAEDIGPVDLSEEMSFPAQSISLFVLP